MDNKSVDKEESVSSLSLPSTEALLKEAKAMGEAGAAVLQIHSEALDCKHHITKELLKLSGEIQTWTKLSDEYLKELRQFRFAAVSEVAQVKIALGDIRKFFLADNHEEEIRRVREFVDLCERLVKLKQDGALDILADTILKLSVK